MVARDITAKSRTTDQQSWMPLWLRVLWAVGILLIVFLGGIVVGMIVERNSYDDMVILGSEWRDLERVITFLETDSYYRPQGEEAIAAWQGEAQSGAINGLLASSGDDYAQYLPPAEAAESEARLTGTYEGIGVSIETGEEGEVKVVSIMLDSPAERADVRLGDIVAQVDSTPIPRGDTELAAELLRGNAGTDVSLVLERPGGNALELELTREEISTGEKTVGYRLFPDHDVAVIQITLFATTTVGELDAALEQAEQDGVARLVLDLRGNPGGWVSAAQGVIGRFVPESAGPALLEDTHPADGDMIEGPIRSDGEHIFGGELIVLINDHTASAAEIVAGALQEYDRAVIAGTASFGKGSVQRVYEFPGGESLRLTIAEWFTPEGRRLQDLGIEPDAGIEVDSSIETLIPELHSIFEEGFPPASRDSTPVPHASPVTAP